MKIIKRGAASFFIIFITWTYAYGESLIFDGGSRIDYLEPILESEFGTGWKRAVFVSAGGSKFDLFPMERLSIDGGVVFSDPADALISPSGRFAVFSIVRAGRLFKIGGEGGEEIASRQYCPVIDTQSGCIVSNMTGEICGGRWDAKVDLWLLGERGDFRDIAKVMAGGNPESAREIWGGFLKISKRNKGFKLSEMIMDSLGVPNILACDPPSHGNKEVYDLISSKLKSEGDIYYEKYIKSKFNRIK